MRGTAKTTQSKTNLKPDPRQRLLDAARQIFAEVGFRAATVREICMRADQNVAAVNYHFGDKLGLYAETLKENISDGIFSYEELDALPPREALRAFLLKVFLSFGSSDRPAFYTKVLMHELALPSEGIDAVLDQVIRPRVKVLEKIVGLLIDLPPAHPKTRLCVLSITGQISYYLSSRTLINSIWPEWKLNSEDFEKVAHHIADFSISALEATKRDLPRAPTKPRRGR